MLGRQRAQSVEAERRGALAVRVALFLIHTYQVVVSPWLGDNCRFVPSCSHYAAEAIARHGLLAGTWLGLRRLLRCHPFHRGGFDPVG